MKDNNAEMNNVEMNNAEVNNAEVKAPGATPEDIIAEAATAGILGDILESALKREKTGVWHQDNKNLIGGIIGGSIAVGLEIASPTGSIASAIAAGVASVGTIAVTHKVLDVAPQTTAIAATNGALTAFIGMSAGRIMADYFPGNLTKSE
ncbi:hypothetical protein F9Z84_06345 [Escherichia coli]|nr:hypothetical protein F9Z84_06345 [Escherichia coli]